MRGSDGDQWTTLTKVGPRATIGMGEGVRGRRVEGGKGGMRA